MTLRHIQNVANTLDYKDNFGQRVSVKIEQLPSGEIWLGLWSKRGEFDGFVLGKTMELASRKIFELATKNRS